MPQYPTPSVLFVTKIKPGAGIQANPTSGTGVVDVAVSGGVVYNAVSTAPTTNVLDLTAANIAGSIKTVLDLTATLTAGASANLPTVAALVTALEAMGITPTAGSNYELDIMNGGSGAFDWTVTTNTGWTLNGTMTIAQTTVRKFIVAFTSATAATLQSLGQYAYTA